MKNLFLILIILIIPAMTNGTTLTWDKNTQAATYTVLIRDQGQTDADYNIVKSGINDTKLVLSPVFDTKTYEYSVKAVNQCGVESLLSDPIKYNPCLSQRMDRVTGLKTVEDSR